MSTAGWFSDPTGRFAQRWYDGAAWTGNVVGASGSVVIDPLPQQDTPYPPPQATPRAAPEAPPVPAATSVAAPSTATTQTQPQWTMPGQQQQWGGPDQWGQQQWGQPQAPGWQQPQGSRAPRYAPGIGLLVSLVGVVCALLSLFVLKWVDGDKGKFLDLSKNARNLGSDHFPFNEASYLYAAWAGFVLFGLVIVLVVFAGIPLPRNSAGNTYARVIGAVLAGGAAVLQANTIAQVFKGATSPEAGAWLGVAGYLVVVVGLVLGARRIRT